ncbi:hypothetical protein NLJ89_g10664 [Agrocybe chaxingu]|uniref:Uncharacterized protein n=1 Tax=Agrocybe chaxingu TaxID=84603 RepID=A0A9W8JRC7_9AGAR|nr:hypothetical protein NLJ89_g10664 [Agrocybe chaxingu]
MAYYPHGQSHDGYVAPQQLWNSNDATMMFNTHASQYLAKYHQHQPPQVQPYQNYHHYPVAQQPYSQERRGSASLAVVGKLTPGMQHQLSSNPLPTPQSILDGTFEAAVAYADTNRDVVTYVPRRPEYSGEPSLPSIIFSVHGRPGPSIGDIIDDKVMLDGPYDLVFRDKLWKQTSLTVDWPGVTSSSGYIPCFRDNRDLTRAQVAKIVAENVKAIVSTGLSGKPLKWGPQVIDAYSKPWNLRKIDYRDVRLIAINYYRKTWIPVLAVNA